jgi:hypothetical protein
MDTFCWMFELMSRKSTKSKFWLSDQGTIERVYWNWQKSTIQYFAWWVAKRIEPPSPWWGVDRGSCRPQCLSCRQVVPSQSFINYLRSYPLVIVLETSVFRCVRSVLLDPDPDPLVRNTDQDYFCLINDSKNIQKKIIFLENLMILLPFGQNLFFQLPQKCPDRIRIRPD